MRESVRVVGISSSPRNGNTEYMVKIALEAAAKTDESVSTQFVSFARRKIEPCTDCKACVKGRRYCVKRDDWLELVQPLLAPEPQGVIIGSPVYFFSTNSTLRAFFERCTSLRKQKWDPSFPYAPPDWSATAGGALAVGFDRNGGVEASVTSIIHWFLTVGMTCVGGSYIGAAGWQGLQDTLDAVASDETGVAAAAELGRRVATTGRWLQMGRTAAANDVRRGHVCDDSGATR